MVETTTSAPVLIIGLGNPILGDDAIGWEVVQRVQMQLHASGEFAGRVIFEYLSLGGLSLMENMVGYDQAVIVDALHTGQLETGAVRRYALYDLPNVMAGHLASAHDTSLHNALAVGRQAGAKLPEDITVIGIESPYVYDFDDQLSPAVAAAIPQAVAEVLRVLDERLNYQTG